MVWSASKADFLDAGGNLQETKEDKIIIETSDNQIILKHGNQGRMIKIEVEDYKENS
jgi:hypothetical protein